jgi:adenylate cyclase
MATEIERKFLLRNDSWKQEADAGTVYHQGYLISTAEKSVRVRIAGNTGYITIKGPKNPGGFGCAEYEYEIPVDDTREMLEILCEYGKIEKTRYKIPYGDHVWEIDVFEGENEGLITAEIELQSENELFEKPNWAGEEITHDIRYQNGMLAKQPFTTWK